MIEAKYIKGLVSVIMPTYKRSQKLLRAIDSILNQTYANLELILVNDNDPNDQYTVELLNKIKCYKNDTRFNLIMQNMHVNGAVARNIGIRQAKGEYIAFLDDDDWWESNKLEEQVNELRTLDESWGGVSCKFTLYNQAGKIIGKSIKYDDGYIYKDILNLISDVATGTLLLRHAYFDTTRYFDETLLRHQDLQLLVDFTSKYKIKEVDQYLHCVDVSDTTNRPNPQKLIAYKKAFFQSVKPVMDTLTLREKRCVYAIHKYEVGYVYIKYGEIRKGIRWCSAIFFSPRSFIIAMKKSLIKIRQSYKR